VFNNPKWNILKIGQIIVIFKKSLTINNFFFSSSGWDSDLLLNKLWDQSLIM
jgi:hypothetical protein